MTWALETGALDGWRWAKWVDRELAEKWLRVLRWELDRNERIGGRALTAEGPVEIPEIETLDRPEQIERLRRMFEAVRGFALACDVFPLALAPYAPARLRCDIGEKDYQSATEPLYTQFGTWRREVMAALLAHSEVVRAIAPPGGVGEWRDPLSVTIRSWVDFGRDGRVEVWDRVGSTAEGVDRMGSDTPGNNPWTATLWNEWAPGALEASREVLVVAMVPLRSTWDLIAGVARVMLRAGLSRLMGLTTSWVAARNVALSRVLGGTGLPVNLVRAVAAVDLRRAGNGELPEGWQTVGGIVTGLAALGGPVAVAVVGAILGLVAALYMIIPVGAMRALDVWNREGPVLERTDYTGVLAPPTPPTHTLPALPADVPLPDLLFAPVLFPALGGGGGAAKKTSPLVIAAALAAALKLMGG